MVTTGRVWARNRDVVELEAHLEAEHGPSVAHHAARLIVRTPRNAARRMLELLERAPLEDGHAVDAGEQMRRLAAGIAAGLTRSSRCKVCGLELRDPRSVELGIGPTCITSPAAAKVAPELATVPA